MASKLSQIQARFQQKQMQEKEEKLLRLYESQQQRAIDRVNRGSAGSNASATSNNTAQGGKVRQMFDERRQKAGIDRSYPLEPLRVTKSNGYNANHNLDNTNTRIVIRQTIKKDTVQVRNSKPFVNKKETSQSVYNNNSEIKSYEEHNFINNINHPVLNRTYRRRDLEMMMRENSRNVNIDDEEFPDINIDEFEEPPPKPKINNVKEIYAEEESIDKRKTPPKTIRNSSKSDKFDTSPKREVKPIVKQPLPKAVRSSPSKEVSSTKPFTPATPTRSTTKQTTSAMSSKAPNNPRESRVPSVSRPSSKQTARGHSAVERDDLQCCKFCNRRFLEDRLTVHEDICAKTLKKKRKTYDATKHRVQGTELEPYTRNQNKSVVQKQTKTPVKKNDWRRKHEEFVSAIRAAKMAQAHIAKGGKISDLPPPPPSENPDYVQCPYCGRRFNETAAERHIPKCATYEFNKPKQMIRPGARK